MVSEGVSLFGALRTIIMADVVMSLDNILAIAGVSHGNVGLLLFGLLLSMPLILFGSGLIANAINRLPWLALVGAGVLAWTGGAMAGGGPGRRWLAGLTSRACTWPSRGCSPPRC